MSVPLKSATGALLLLLHTTAQACGYCVEDKMAAVYDHAVVVRAVEHKHRVAFFALAGPLSAQDSGMRHAIERAVESTYGVDRHSSRVSVENAALSFSFDSKAVPFALIQRTLERKLSARGVSLELLSTMDRPADLSVIGSRR